MGFVIFPANIISPVVLLKTKNTNGLSNTTLEAMLRLFLEAEGRIPETYQIYYYSKLMGMLVNLVNSRTRKICEHRKKNPVPF